MVTGGTGFIGRALVGELRRRGSEVIGLGSGNGWIDDPAIWQTVGVGEIEWLFHLAGRTYVPDSWEDPVGFLRTNVLGTANVLEFCRARKVPVTYVSAYLYGQPESLPIDENAPVRPNNPYAMSKWISERMCEFYARAHGLNVTVIRPFNVHGVGQDDRFLIPTIVKQALFDDVITVKDLRPKRDYVYLDDLVEALILTMGRAGGYSVYNIGSGVSLSVQDIIDVVQSAARTKKRVSCTDTVRRNEIDDVVADISRARQHLGWHPRHSFAEGISRIVEAASGARNE